MARASTRELADRLVPDGTAAYIAKRRDTTPPTSYAEIAFELRTQFEVQVTGETVRVWHGDDLAAADEPLGAA